MRFPRALALAALLLLAAACSEESPRPAPPSATAQPERAASPLDAPRYDPHDSATPAQNGAPLALEGTRLVLGAPLLDTSAPGAATLVELDGAHPHRVRIVPFDAAPDAGFGASLALAGDTLAVAAPHDRDEHGTVTLYARQPDDAWRATQRLDAHGLRWLGEALALDGPRLAVRARTNDQSRGQHGAVALYNQRHGTWEHETTLVQPEDPGRAWQFGKALALAGDTLFVGAPGAALRGAVFVYQPEPANGEPTRWTLRQTLTSSLPDDVQENDDFGASLVAHGDRLYVAAQFQDPGGVVSVFARDAHGRWVREQELASPGGSVRLFGRRLALDPDSGQLAVASADTDAFADLVHVFAPGPDALVETARGALPETHRLAALALTPDGSLIAAESPVDSAGRVNPIRARRYASDGHGGWQLARTWTLDAMLAGDPDAPLPARREPIDLAALHTAQPDAVALDGGVLVVGEPALDEAGAAQLGAAHVFERDARGAWHPVAKLRPEHLVSYQRAGHDLALRGDVLVVAAPGAPAHDDVPAVAPQVFVYRRGNDGVWAHAGTMRIKDETFLPEEALELELSLSDGLLAVLVRSARRSSEPGRVLVFERDAAAASGFRPAVALDRDALGAYRVAVGRDEVAVTCRREVSVVDEEEGRRSEMRGCVQIWGRDAQSGRWHVTAQLDAPPESIAQPAGGEAFGSALAFAGAWLLVGDPSALPGLHHALETRGAVFAWQRDGDTWTLDETLIAPSELRDAQGFGRALVASGTQLVVEAGYRSLRPDQHVRDSALWRYELDPRVDWTLRGRLDAPFDTSWRTELALSGTALALSARRLRDDVPEGRVVVLEGE